MFLLKIAKLGNPVIRSGTDPLSQEELNTPSLQNLIDAMIQTMRDADGVGIAAPQVHVAKQIIVIEVSPNNPRYPHRQTVPLTVIINPEITFQSENQQEDWEGCLSVPDFRAKVPRASWVRVSGLDRYGKPLEIEANHFFARVIQHEVDHLKGKVFLDRLPNLKTLTYLREYQKYWQSETPD
jgi:peptide deformylase